MKNFYKITKMCAIALMLIFFSLSNCMKPLSESAIAAIRKDATKNAIRRAGETFKSVAGTSLRERENVSEINRVVALQNREIGILINYFIKQGGEIPELELLSSIRVLINQINKGFDILKEPKIRASQIDRYFRFNWDRPLRKARSEAENLRADNPYVAEVVPELLGNLSILKERLYGLLQGMRDTMRELNAKKRAARKKRREMRREKKRREMRREFTQQLDAAFKKLAVSPEEKIRIRGWFDAHSATFEIPRWRAFMEKKVPGTVGPSGAMEPETVEHAVGRLRG